jgi:hypothetical protein
LTVDSEQQAVGTRPLTNIHDQLSTINHSAAIHFFRTELATAEEQA